MKTKAASTLREMSEDELADERQAADQEMQALKAYKGEIQKVIDERDALKSLSGVNLDNPAVRDLLSQHISEVGNIESEEASGTPDA